MTNFLELIGAAVIVGFVWGIVDAAIKIHKDLSQ